jgi:hypothetical protein
VLPHRPLPVHNIYSRCPDDQGASGELERPATAKSLCAAGALTLSYAGDIASVVTHSGPWMRSDIEKTSHA